MNRLTMLLAAFTALAVAATAAVVFLVVLDDAPRQDNKIEEPVAFADLDVDAWVADLNAIDVDPPAGKLERLYELVVEDCAATVSHLSLRFTMQFANPARDRVNLHHICPSQEHKVDDALARNDETSGMVARLCTTPPEARTEDEREFMEALADPSCL